MRIVVVATLLIAACGPPTSQPTTWPTLAESPVPADAASADRRPADAMPDPDDRDGDRVLDICDACPDEPETYQGMTDEDGCPDAPVDDFDAVNHRKQYNARPPDSCPEELRYEP